MSYLDVQIILSKSKISTINGYNWLYEIPATKVPTICFSRRTIDSAKAGRQRAGHLSRWDFPAPKAICTAYLFQDVQDELKNAEGAVGLCLHRPPEGRAVSTALGGHLCSLLGMSGPSGFSSLGEISTINSIGKSLRENV